MMAQKQIFRSQIGARLTGFTIAVLIAASCFIASAGATELQALQGSYSAHQLPANTQKIVMASLPSHKPARTHTKYVSVARPAAISRNMHPRTKGHVNLREAALFSRRQRINCANRQNPGMRNRVSNPAAWNAYCRAVKKHDAMINAFDHYKRIYKAKQGGPVKPELALDGGTDNQQLPKAVKQAFFDFWVARQAYDRALNSYKLALRKGKGRRKTLWR